LALMRDFFIAAIARQILRGGEAMGKGIAVNVGSHETKEKASQKLALSIAIVKASSPLLLFYNVVRRRVQALASRPPSTSR